MRRLSAVWAGLASEQRLAAVAAVATMLSTLLPWYAVTPVRGPGRTVSAFGVYSFVEAAIFLVALAVLGLLWARAEGKGFHLPGGDGTVVLVAGAWIVFLVFYRQFDRPEVQGALVGVTWGIFVTVLAGAGLALAGWRLRAADLPEPPPPPDRAPTRVVPADEARTTVADRPWPARPRKGDEPEQLSFDER